MEFFRKLFDSESFMPHGHCYFWQEDIVFLNVVANAMIALAYFTIPITLFIFVKKRKDIPFNIMFVMFASFIFFCGTTHILKIITIWKPIYRLDASVDFLTGIISLITGGYLIYIMPKALTMPSRAQLEAVNNELDTLNGQLKEVIRTKEEAEKREKKEKDFSASIINNSRNIITAVDKDFKYTAWNPAAERYSGLAKDEVIGKNVLDLFPFLENSEAVKAYKAALKGEVTELDAVRFIIPQTGKEAYYKGIYSPLRGPDGEIEGALAVLDDITDEAKMQVELQKNVALYKLLAENSSDIISVRDKNGVFKYVSPAIGHILHYNADDVLGRSIFEFVHPEDETELKKLHEAAISSNDTITATFRLRANDGKYLWFESLSHRIIEPASGQLYEIHAASRDITARKVAEESLHKQTEFLNAVLENIQDGIVACDETGKLTLFNNATRNFHGLPALPLFSDQWAGKYSLYHADGETLMKQQEIPLYRAYNGEEIQNVGMIVRRADGISFNLQVSGRPIYDNTGRKLGAVIVMHNITEQKEAEWKLREKNRQLEMTNHELEQFAYVASHDLKEPLRMIASYSQLLVRKYSTQNDEAKEFSAYIIEGVSRMQALLNDLLKFSTIDKTEIDFQKVDVNEILKNVEESLHLKIEETGAIIKNNELPVLEAVPSQIYLLFQNLVENAIKFRKEGVCPEIHISAQRRNPGEWLFQVSDNGIGMDIKYAEKIFVIFQRLHGRERYPGTGIGLAICRKIVEFHGGEIWFESTPGQGTTFYFTLMEKK